MRINKKSVLRIFFGVELVVFAGIYISGAQGISTLWHMNQENQQLITEIAVLKNEIGLLDKQLIAWNNHDFYKEKIAREELQMARAHDEVYFIMQR
jgi:cell division protein FtsB